MSDTARVQPTFDAPLIQRPPERTSRAPGATVDETPSAPPAETAQRIFISDRPGDAGFGEASPALSRLSQLLAHGGAEGPMTIALIGGPGSGKTRAMSQLIEGASALSKAAEGRASSPYLAGLVTVHLDAGDLAADPRAAIAERVHGTLSRLAPELAAEAADEANQSTGDPHARLAAINESLDSSRRRLDAERRARDEAESRRARLVETILYESGGSRVDAYARANRTGIEYALTSFGFSRGDTLGTYKGLVQTLSHAGGPAARLVASLRSLWAYRGQTKLLVWTVLLLLIGWGFGFLRQDQSWLGSLRAQGDWATRLAEFISLHANWFTIAKNVAWLGALLCALTCVWRAIRFSRPLLRGASLVDADLAIRRGELDNLVAHHTQRVEALSGETDGLVRRATEAERRTSGAQTPTPAYLTAGEATASDRSRQNYLSHVDARLGRSGSPSRVAVVLDDLDSLAPQAALAALERSTAALRSPRYAIVTAFDAERLIAALGPKTRQVLDKLVQIPFRVDADGGAGWSDAIAALTSARAPTAAKQVDPNRSSLDTPIHEAEQQLLAAVAPLAGPSPRRVKRLVNLYRLGRQDAADSLAAFAFALALAIGGTAEEKTAFDQAIRIGDGTQPLSRDAGGRLRAALEALDAFGRPITVEDARRSRKAAARWSVSE